MTGDRKWKAVETPSGFWELHDEDGYALLEDLTESEARDIAAIDDIKAERDTYRDNLASEREKLVIFSKDVIELERIKAERGEAVELLRRIGEGPLIDGKIDVEVDVFNASIKEQNEKAKAKAGT